MLTKQFSSSTEQAVEGTRIEAASEQPSLVSMAESFEEIRRNPCFNNVMECCERIGNNRKLSTSQIAILWCLQKGFITSIVVGCNDVQELEENMSCLTENLYLSEQEMSELEEASCWMSQYPYNINLSSIAGIREIQPFECCNFEQLNLTVPEKLYEITKPSETLHEAKGQFFPEQESLKQPQLRTEQQRSIS